MVDAPSTNETPHLVENINAIVGAAFRSANAKRARSQQRTIGMSELGGCRRQAGFKVLGIEPTNPEEQRTDKFADSREAMIGTMIHETILPQIRDMSITAEIEVPVILRFDGLPDIPGSSDLIDQSENLVLDVKTTGRYSSDYVKSHGPSKKHLWQTHGYATAAIQAGIPIDRIALVYIDRSDGQVIHVHHQLYEPHIVDDIEAWWREVNSTDDPFTLPRDEKGPGLSKTCDWCIIPETQILMPDYTWRIAEDIQIGDVIMGWTEPSKGRKGKLVPTEVTMVRRRNAPLVRVNGDLVVAEGTKFSRGYGWQKVERIEGKDVKFVTAPIKRDQEMYERGWLSGMAEGDGTFWWHKDTKGENRWRGFRIALKDDADILLGRFDEYASNAGFEFRRGQHTHTSFNGVTSEMLATRMGNTDARKFEEWITETPDDESWIWGYLGGICDAEGCVTGKSGVIRISQYAHKNEITYERIGMALRRVGFNPVAEWNGWRLHSKDGELFRFLAGATPGRPQFAALGLNRAPNHVTRVHEVIPAGEGEVVSLTTETGSYIAEGYVVHNCPWLTACWGPDAVPGEKGVQKVILDEVPSEGRAAEIETMLRKYKESADQEKAALAEKKFAREVLTGVASGTYGSMVLKWGSPSTYEQLDSGAAEQALTAAGLPVPKIERSRDATINVKRKSK